MAKNLVDRLRTSVPKMVGPAQAHCNDVEAVHLAADEIERLRRGLEDAEKWFEGEGMHRQADAIHAVLAFNR